jgi:two-component system, NtrC family, sensor kinase
MPDISIRWRILFFFCLLGLLPQVAISYFSMYAYTRSLEQTYNNQVSQLVVQAAEQTSVKSLHLINDLKDQATQPYIQLSFQQYPLSTRFQLLKERLELFRVSRGNYDRLTLCFLNGEPLLSTQPLENEKEYISFERAAIRDNSVGLNQIRKPFQRIYSPASELVLFIPINSFRWSTKVVGYMVAYLPISEFTTYLEKLELGLNAQKSILTTNGKLIKSFNVNENKKSYFLLRHYSADVQPLSWRIVVSISENELFSDVIWLKQKIMMFIGSIVVLAFGLVFIFSHRFTRPFKKIIEGTRTFATGNLEHRITVESGHEAKQLAAAFNDMAGQLNDRQQELNQAVRLASLGVMTAGIGHEIKNPLTGIKISSQVINKILASKNSLIGTKKLSKEQVDDFLEVAELARGISDEADRLTKILNDLLEFGRPREAKSVSFNIVDTVTHAISLVRAKVEKKQVKIEIQLTPLQIVADPDQILQVLLNLLLNALEAVADHAGLIYIISELSPDSTVSLRIIDNGAGIAEDKVHRIFDPFFSLHEGGTGLGLSVVYTLLKQNNASVNVMSGLNQGTEFKITFTGGNNVQKDIVND